jgi:hypothetical protein
LRIRFSKQIRKTLVLAKFFTWEMEKKHFSY